MSSIWKLFEGLNPVRIAVVWGVLYFIDYAMKPIHKKRANDVDAQDVPQLDHMDPARGPVARTVDTNGKAEPAF